MHLTEIYMSVKARKATPKKNVDCGGERNLTASW